MHFRQQGALTTCFDFPGWSVGADLLRCVETFSLGVVLRCIPVNQIDSPYPVILS